MSRLGIVGAAVAGLAVALLVVAVAVMKDQRDIARGRLETTQAQLAAAERALADEKASTAEALANTKRCEDTFAEVSARFQEAIADLNARLQRYREQLTGCLDPAVLVDRGGRLFPGPVQPDAPAPAVPR